MLTKEAFNAILKTLEEPPSHAIFILATTETEKIPETVISRCQVFSFKKPNRDILKTLVNKVIKSEGYEIESGGSDLIALLGDGSFRDTLGILQKVISVSNNSKILIKEIEEITGAPKGNLVNDFILSLSKGDKNKALNVISKIQELNISIKTFISIILERLRIVLLLKNIDSSEKEKIKDLLSEEDWVFLNDISKDKDSKINSKVLYEILKSYDATGKSYIDSLPLELSVIDMFQ